MAGTFVSFPSEPDLSLLNTTATPLYQFVNIDSVTVDKSTVTINELYWIRDYEKFGASGYVWKDAAKKSRVEQLLGIGG